MPPTLVHVAVGALLGAALLGAAYDRRTVAVVAAAALFPDLDAVASLALPGATNALLHSLWLPAVAAAALYWDGRLRDSSALRARFGWRGQRVAWVAVAAYAVAGVGLDLFSSAGVNALYPVHDRFYAVTGRFYLSNHDGVVQTYLFEGGRVLASPGGPDHRVGNWLTPGASGEYRLSVVEAGWQATVLLTAAAVLLVRGTDLEVDR